MQILIYLFGFYPGAKFAWFYPLLIIFLVLFVGSIIFNIYLGKQKSSAFERTFRRFPGHLQVLSILGIVLILARIAGVGFFSMRAFLFILLLTLGVIIAINIQKFFILLPKNKTEITEDVKLSKYLPKKKKK